MRVSLSVTLAFAQGPGEVADPPYPHGMISPTGQRHALTLKALGLG